MSDKFVVSTNEIGAIIVTDVETGNVYHYGSMSNFLGLIRLLNEQESTIIKQKEEIKKLKKTERSWRKIHCCNKESDNCGIVIEQQAKIDRLNSDYKYLKEVNKETVKQCERWKNLYELKDAEVTARVDALNEVCEYYTSEVLFKSDVDPNKAVKEVINRILNTEVKWGE